MNLETVYPLLSTDTISKWCRQIPISSMKLRCLSMSVLSYVEKDMNQNTKTTDIHRYTPYGYIEYEHDDSCYAVVDMERDLAGEWVKWEDVEKLLNEHKGNG